AGRDAAGAGPDQRDCGRPAREHAQDHRVSGARPGRGRQPGRLPRAGEDLLLKPDFIRENLACLEEIARASRDLIAIVGFVDRAEDLYNAAAVLYDGRLAGVYHKQFLPNYGVFDEDRYYRAGTETPLFVIGGIACGVSICEDIWYPTGPTALQAQAGARLLV